MPADRFLLDTNIVSALLRDPQGPIAKEIERAGEDAICTSIIVAAELRFGAWLATMAAFFFNPPTPFYL
jgi:tRNA(fMet)-specific endonuclease VapC